MIQEGMAEFGLPESKPINNSPKPASMIQTGHPDSKWKILPSWGINLKTTRMVAVRINTIPKEILVRSLIGLGNFIMLIVIEDYN